MIPYDRSDFDPVPNVPGKFYCPGCNRYPEDYIIPSVSCPCVKYGTGHGSLTSTGVERYLAAQAALDPQP